MTRQALRVSPRLALIAISVVACKKADSIVHQRVGDFEVAVVGIEERPEAFMPGIKVQPRANEKFVVASLHVRRLSGAGDLDSKNVVLTGSLGTTAAAMSGWGDGTLTNTFRVLEYWFSLPKAEAAVSIRLGPESIALAGLRNHALWSVKVTSSQVLEAIDVQSVGGGHETFSVREGRKALILDVLFETLLPVPDELPKADGGERGDLLIYLKTPGPDVGFRLAQVAVVGPENNPFYDIGAVAPVKSDKFIAGDAVSIASRQHRLSCRLASLVRSEDLPKLNALRFSGISTPIPR
jgi:hypothetical protein